jgi:hypothetical protein
MKHEKDTIQRISPDRLLALIGPSPADNLEGYDTAVLWRSELVAPMVKGLFAWRNFLESISGNPLLFGPMAMAAGLQKSMLETFVINPAKVTARALIFLLNRMNGWSKPTPGCCMKNVVFSSETVALTEIKP